MITWHDLAFYSSVAGFLLMTTIVLLERKIYLGFTVMAFVVLAISTNSEVLINRLTDYDVLWLRQIRAEAITINGVGDICFGLGVILAILLIRRPAGGVPQRSALLQHPRALLALFSIGVISALLLPLTVKIPTLASVQSQLEWLCLLALFCWLYGCSWNFWLAGMVAIWFLLGLLQVTRTTHLGGLIYVLQLGLIALFGRQITWRRMLMSLVLAGSFLIMIGTWFQLRSFIRDGRMDTTSGRSSQILGLFTEIWEHPFLKSDYKKDLYYIWEWRVDFSEYYANERAWMPSHEPYAGWSTVFPSVLAAVVPRVVWPEKSMVQGGTEYIDRFTGWDFDPAVISFDMAFPFEFYAMFGAKGVAIGMFLLGFGIAYAERLICQRRLSIVSTMALLAFLETVYTGGDQIRLRVVVLGAALGLFVMIGMILESMVTRQTSTMGRPRQVPIPL